MKDRGEFFHRIDLRIAQACDLEVRSRREMGIIIDRALELSNGDADKAGRLMRMVMYEYGGQTWNTSLQCADSSADLLTASEVFLAMETLVSQGVDEKALLEDVIESYCYDLLEFPFYLAMVHDLLGQAGVDKLRELMVRLGLEDISETITAQDLVEARRVYDQVAGRLMSEWTDETLVGYLADALGFLGDLRILGETQTDEAALALWCNRTETCRTIREIVSELSARGLIAERRPLKIKVMGEERTIGLREVARLLAATQLVTG